MSFLEEYKTDEKKVTTLFAKRTVIRECHGDKETANDSMVLSDHTTDMLVNSALFDSCSEDGDSYTVLLKTKSGNFASQKLSLDRVNQYLTLTDMQTDKTVKMPLGKISLSAIEAREHPKMVIARYERLCCMLVMTESQKLLKIYFREPTSMNNVLSLFC